MFENIDDFDMQSYAKVQAAADKKLKEALAEEKKTGKVSEDLKRIRAMLKRSK